MTAMENYRPTYDEFNKQLSESLDRVYQKVGNRTADALKYLPLIPQLLPSDDYDWATEDIDRVLKRLGDMFSMTKYVLRYLGNVINDGNFRSWLNQETITLDRSMNDVMSRLTRIKEDGSYNTVTGLSAGMGAINHSVKRDETIKVRDRLREMIQEIRRR